MSTRVNADPTTVLAKRRTAHLGDWDMLPPVLRSKALYKARQHAEEVRAAEAEAEQVGGGQGGE